MINKSDSRFAVVRFFKSLVREKHLDNHIHLYSLLEAEFFLFFSPVSPPVHQLSHVALITLLTNSASLHDICLPITHLVLLHKNKMTFTVKILCR